MERPGETTKLDFGFSFLLYLRPAQNLCTHPAVGELPRALEPDNTATVQGANASFFWEKEGRTR